jgi:hypothetical protein
LIIWDIVFGTRKLPPRAPPEDVGFSDPPAFPQTFWPQLLAPFRRALWSAKPPPRD